jgi:hypothetical protein
MPRLAEAKQAEPFSDSCTFVLMGNQYHLRLAERGRNNIEKSNIKWLTPFPTPLSSLMTTELCFLAASIILGLVHLIVDSHLISFQYGYRWTASSREQPVPPLRGVADRMTKLTPTSWRHFLSSPP